MVSSNPSNFSSSRRHAVRAASTFELGDRRGASYSEIKRPENPENDPFGVDIRFCSLLTID
jgi:hypothetical protein